MNKPKLKILFFYVHPAKFHLFKNAINLLKREGHQVEIVISNKEVLSSLLEAANVKFTNLFPKGRKISFLPNKANAAIGLIRTLWKLWLFTRKKKHDVYVTDDVLTILGKFQRIPSIAFTDNDLVTVPLIKLIFKSADKIIAPSSTSLADLEYKKVAFKGNKAIAHLSPLYFKKDTSILKKYGLQDKEFLIIRLAKLNANHDINGNPGITDNDLAKLIEIVPKKFEILISSEREIAEQYRKYLHNILPNDFTQVLACSSFFIGDSGTMATEAAILGIPNVLINNIAKECGVHRELKTKYELQYYYDNFTEAFEYLMKLLNDNTLINRFKLKQQDFFSDSEDFNVLLVKTIYKLSTNEEKH